MVRHFLNSISTVLNFKWKDIMHGNLYFEPRKYTTVFNDGIYEGKRYFEANIIFLRCFLMLLDILPIQFQPFLILNVIHERMGNYILEQENIKQFIFKDGIREGKRTYILRGVYISNYFLNFKICISNYFLNVF